jgi:hypothetical protein
LINADPRLAVVTYASGDSAGATGFVRAVRDHASPETKLAFINAMAQSGRIQEPQLLKHPDFAPMAKHGLYNPQAEAVGQVLSSLKGEQFDKAVKMLSDDQLKAVVHSAAHYTRLPEFATHSHNTALLTKIINAAATANDPDIKAAIFIAAVEAFDFPAGEGMSSSAKQQVSGALTNLLGSDPTGMMNAFYEREATMDSLVKYLTAKVENKEYSDIDNILIKLKSGTDPSKTEAQFLGEKSTDENGDEWFRNEENLGYYVGSIAAAINSVASTDKERATIAGNIVTTLLWAGTTPLKPGAQASGATGSGFTNDLVRRTRL